MRAGDRRDPPVAELVEMADGEPGSADVVRRDIARALPGEVEVDRDQRDLRIEKPLDLRVVPVDTHEHDPVDAVMPCAPKVRVLAVPARVRLLAREEQDVVAGAT
jgi:hypothetical protein